MAAKSLIKSPKSMEEAITLSIERTTRFVNLSCDTVGRRYDLMGFILLKEHSHDVTETDNVSRSWTALANVVYGSSPVDGM
jgi:hypothetical protein